MWVPEMGESYSCSAQTFRRNISPTLDLLRSGSALGFGGTTLDLVSWFFVVTIAWYVGGLNGAKGRAFFICVRRE